MNPASPNHSMPHISPCNAANLVMRCLCVWALLLTGAFAQTTSTDTSTTDTSTSTTSGGSIIFTGSTLTLNNNTGGQTGVITLTGNNLLTVTDGTTTSNATLNLGTVIGTGTTTGTTIDTSTNGLVLSGTIGSTSGVTINGSITTGVANNYYTGATIALGSSVSAVLYGNAVSNVIGSTSLFKTGTGILSFGSSGVINSVGNGNGGTITLNVSGTNTAADLINSVGTLPAYGTLVISSGGVLNLSGISASGLSLVGGTNVTGGTTLGTTGLTLTTTSTTAQLSGSVNVTTLGSVPVGNTPTSASFAAPAVALLGVGNVGSQGVSERGVIYSLTSANGSPTLGGAGVVKVVHTGLPDATGGFSLTAAGLAAKTSYTYRVYATDSTGATILSPPSTFITPTVLQNWRQTFFGTIQGTNHAADNADPDGDGLPNLIEFATGKDPTISQTASGTGASVNAGTLEYTYTRSLDALNSGTTFTVEWNDTLDPTQWSNTGVTEVILSDDGLLQQVKATLPASSTGNRFVRLKVVPPADSSTGVTNTTVGTSAP